MEATGKGTVHQQQSAPNIGRAILIWLVILCAFGALLGNALLRRQRAGTQLTQTEKEANTNAQQPLVTVTHPQAMPATSTLDLPGTVEAVEETGVSARATGYLSQYLVDIGDRVKAGQTLALLKTPDTDQEYYGAKADLGNRQAALAQSQATAAGAAAGTAEAQANISKAESALSQAQADTARARAAVAQAEQAAQQQRAQLASAQASRNLAKVTADRYANMLKEGAIDQQTTDQKQVDYQTSVASVEAQESSVKAADANTAALKEAVRSAESNVASAQNTVKAAQAAERASAEQTRASVAGIRAAAANVTSSQANTRRYAVLQDFQKITAPFDGVITARNVGVGALVAANTATSADASNGTGSSAGDGLFRIARTDTVRVFVDVSQTYAGAVYPGQPVNVSIDELGSKPFTGKVARNTTIYDPQTRTLRTEIDVPNQGGRIRPGMFATAHLSLKRTSGSWLIPDDALMTDASGTHIAVIDANDQLAFRNVTIGRDYGKSLEITTGLNGGETLVANPTSALADGMKVRIAPPPKTDAAGGAGGGADGGKRGGHKRQQ